MDNNEYYGITLNDKIPKLDKINLCKNKVVIKFEGKAYIIEKTKDKKIIKKEIQNNCKLTKQKNYEIEFTNNKNEEYFIKVKLENSYIIFILLFLITFISLIFFILNPKTKQEISQNRIFDFINLSILKFNNNSSKNSQYDFDVTLKDTKKIDKSTKTNFSKSQEVNLEDTINMESFVEEKIAPGMDGFFSIIINSKNNNSDIKYYIKFIDLNEEKPQNMNFKIKGEKKIYSSLKDMEDNLNGVIEKNGKKIITIEWCWPYEQGLNNNSVSKNDKIDTDNAINFRNYKFQINVIGEEVN